MTLYDAKILSGDGGDGFMEIEYRHEKGHRVKVTSINAESGESIALEIAFDDFMKAAAEIKAARDARDKLLADAVALVEHRKAGTA